VLARIDAIAGAARITLIQAQVAAHGAGRRRAISRRPS
jgi:hypothetical protein